MTRLPISHSTRRPVLRSDRWALILSTVLPTVLTIGFLAGNSGATEPPATGAPLEVASAPEIQPNSDWRQHGRVSGETRFSPLEQIERNNAADLGLAWSYATGSDRGLEATPLVVGNVLYATASWSIAFAVDATTGTELWRFDPEVPRWKAKHACCGAVNRGVAYHDGRIYLGTLDGRLIALDAASGTPIWSVRTTDLTEPYTITGAPRIVKDLVLIGNGGAEFGVRGFFSAYHAETGELAWRFYTVPASKDGPHEHVELEAAAATWSTDSLFETGLGGTAWDSMAYDAELDLLYVGTGNSSVYDRAKRSPGGGDNLYLASILALRPDTGRLVWHYQTTPGESWDYTATQHIILADLEWQGAPRKVLMQAPKNGFFYVLDRETGELLSAENFVHTSWASHIDLRTGRPVERPESNWSESAKLVSPAPTGAHNWHPMSFDPDSGYVFIPASESPYAYHPHPDFKFRPGLWNTGEDLPQLHREIEDLGAMRFLPCGLTRLIAWDPRKGEKAWEVLHDSGVPGGTLATAGHLVFQGSGNGRFSAFDTMNGAERWAVDIGIDVMAPPVTYQIDGVQYIAVLAGVGGSQGNHMSTFDHDNAGRLLAFKLGGTAKMPAVRKRPIRSVSVPRLSATPAVIDRGRTVYAENCFSCHGMGTQASGLYPDLKTASAETHEEWDAIVRGGIRTHKGMPSFASSVSSDDARAVQAYVLDRAWHSAGISERVIDWAAKNICVPVSWITN